MGCDGVGRVCVLRGWEGDPAALFMVGGEGHMDMLGVRRHAQKPLGRSLWWTQWWTDDCLFYGLQDHMFTFPLMSVALMLTADPKYPLQNELSWIKWVNVASHMYAEMLEI